MLPLALAGVAAWDLAACSAADYSGRQSPRQAAWLWPQGQAGELPWQARPPMLTDDRTAGASAATSGGVAGGVFEPTPPRTPVRHRRRLLQTVNGEVGGSGRRGAGGSGDDAAAPAAATAPSYTFPDSAALVAALAAGQLGGPSSRRPSLRIVILTVGTRGDMQPYLSLGSVLREAGHAVTISSTDDFGPMVTGAGLTFAPTGMPRMEQPAGWTAPSTKTVGDFIRAVCEPLSHEYGKLATGFEAAVVAAGADVIVGTAHTLTFALNLGEARGLPVWCAKLAPDLPSRAWTNPGTPLSPIGWLNLLRCCAYWIDVAGAVESTGISRAEAVERARLGLSPKPPMWQRVEQMSATPQLLGFSPVLFPKPTDFPVWAFQCGFWQGSNGGDDGGTGGTGAINSKADASAALTAAGATTPADAAALSAFLAAREQPAPEGEGDGASSSPSGGSGGGRSPVAVVTFGSMVHARDDMLADITAALRAARFKVLLLTGWKGDLIPTGVPTPAQDPCVLCTREMPHDWLFRQVAGLVVHHGGAGTTGRALSCGVPSIVVPVLRWSDQMQWGELVEALGVGVLVRAFPPTRADFTAAVKAVMRGSHVTSPYTGFLIGDTANALGAAVRAERAGENARAALESCLCNAVLSPEEADAIHPLAEGSAAAASSLSAAQRMCLRCCVPCHMLRRGNVAALRALVGRRPVEAAVGAVGGGGGGGVVSPPLSAAAAAASPPPSELRRRAREQQQLLANGVVDESPAAATAAPLPSHSEFNGGGGCGVAPSSPAVEAVRGVLRGIASSAWSAAATAASGGSRRSASSPNREASPSSGGGDFSGGSRGRARRLSGASTATAATDTTVPGSPPPPSPSQWRRRKSPSSTRGTQGRPSSQEEGEGAEATPSTPPPASRARGGGGGGSVSAGTAGSGHSREGSPAVVVLKSGGRAVAGRGGSVGRGGSGNTDSPVVSLRSARRAAGGGAGAAGATAAVDMVVPRALQASAGWVQR